MGKTIAGAKAVILAGGGGERFWPLSTPKRPKQFLDVFGGKSLLRQTVSRLAGVFAPEDFFVVTSRSFVTVTRRELPEVPRSNVIGEPMRRDTGAAVALGVAAASAGCDGDPVLVFLPADQMVGRPAAFRTAIRKAMAVAKREPRIVTLGISPDRAATEYGYVDPKKGRFVEKPPADKAAEYVKKGFLWNAGMFIARSSVFKKAFSDHAPGLMPVFDAAGGRGASSFRSLGALYSSLPRVSFDYAVMEKLPRVEVVAADCGWDDVGGYGAFRRHFPVDANGNVVRGDCALIDSSGNICISNSVRVSILGVDNLVVVATRDGVLVVPKSRASEIKRFFAK